MHKGRGGGGGGVNLAAMFVKLFSLLAGLLWLAHKGTVKSFLVNNWRLTGTRLIS